jgi:Tol biopolymer transport system component
MKPSIRASLLLALVILLAADQRSSRRDASLGAGHEIRAWSPARRALTGQAFEDPAFSAGLPADVLSAISDVSGVDMSLFGLPASARPGSTQVSDGGDGLDLGNLLSGAQLVRGQSVIVEFSFDGFSFEALALASPIVFEGVDGRVVSMAILQGVSIGLNSGAGDGDQEIPGQPVPEPEPDGFPRTTGGGLIGTTAIDRPSIAFDGQQGDAGSSLGVVTTDGNHIAFASSATNLVADDTNDKADIFVRDRATAWTSRISVATSGAQANDASTGPAMSADGRYVVFESDATNLVANDTNARRDIFLRDRQLNTTTRLSTSTIGAEPNGDCDRPRISADGRFVVFESDATNLVGEDANAGRDIFLRDRHANHLTRVSLTAAGAEASGASSDATISDDGSIICFTSDAPDLVAGDTNGSTDIFLRHRATGTSSRISLGNGFVQGNGGSFSGRVSGDGRFVVFTSAATNLAPGDTNNTDDVFLRDRTNATTIRVTVSPLQASNGSEAVAISADGRYIVYNSSDDNPIAGDTNSVLDVYIHDHKTFLTRRASVGKAGQQPLAPCFGTALSTDGRYVIFHTVAGSLVTGDTNSKSDVFLRDMAKP